jgi:hypothetical protein
MLPRRESKKSDETVEDYWRRVANEIGKNECYDCAWLLKDAEYWKETIGECKMVSFSDGPRFMVVETSKAGKKETKTFVFNERSWYQRGRPLDIGVDKRISDLVLEHSKNYSSSEIVDLGRVVHESGIYDEVEVHEDDYDSDYSCDS